MKQLFFCAIVLAFVSCAKKKTDVLATESNLVEKSDTPSTIESSLSDVPALSFEELEPLLTMNNDTTYVVNFWATWCKPCVKEMPYFEKLNSQYAKDKVKVIFVSLDFPEVLESKMALFLEKYNIQSQVVLLDDADANSWIPKISTEWSGAIPATLMYNQRHRKFYEQAFTYEQLETEIKSIL